MPAPPPPAHALDRASGAGVKAAASLLLLGSLLFGFAHIAALPPYEGGDETAHVSYTEQLAETGTWPRFGDPLSAEIEQYEAHAPVTFSRVWTYGAFFNASADIVETG